MGIDLHQEIEYAEFRDWVIEHRDKVIDYLLLKEEGLLIEIRNWFEENKDKDYLMCPKCKVNKPHCKCVLSVKEVAK